MLDEVDRRIVGALQVDGRAPVGRIAAVLAVSPRTVTRRLARLHGAGVLRVVRVPETAAYPLGALLLRIKVLRGRTDAVAEALARREDVPFVDIGLGGEEITALALPVPADRDRLLYEQLPATTAVAAVTTYAILHVFADAADWRTGELTEPQVRALTPPEPTLAPAPPDDLDRALVARLEIDARTGPGELAAAVRAPESTVRRRLAQLADSGQLRTHATIDPRLLGLTVDAHLWLTVPPDRLHQVGVELARHREVHGVVATTGASNLLATVFCADQASLYRFVTETLGALHVATAETSIVGRAVKRAGVHHT